MKVLFVSVNAKYIHMNPAVRVFDKLAKDAGFESEFVELTINDIFLDMLAFLYKKKADIYMFSCYIWNIEIILKLSAELKKLYPKAKIVLGGPEVSYNTEDVLKNDFIDFIISGEGEELIVPLIQSIITDKNIKSPYIATRENPSAVPAVTSNLNGPFPYSPEELRSGKIIYYETSRGCPYRCSYCVSSINPGLRFVDDDRVIADVNYMCRMGAKIIKFVDRTFNANRERALRFFKEFAAIDANTVFHFEICAHLLDDETISLLSKVPRGKFQFEIGIQSTNILTLRAINRLTDLNRVFSNIEKLKKAGNIHLHLDLIAGLPYDTIGQFESSFNNVYPFADNLQLGFLKMLHGTEIRRNSNRFGYRYLNHPPYEILENGFMSYKDILKLKSIEDVLERFSNSGRFRASLSYISGFFRTPYEMFEVLANFFDPIKEKGNISVKELYFILYKFSKEILKINEQAFIDLIKFDYACNFRGGLSGELAFDEDKAFKNKCKEILKDEKYLKNIFNYYPDINYQDIMKNIEIHKFITFNKRERVLIFDYKYAKITDITQIFNEEKG